MNTYKVAFFSNTKQRWFTKEYIASSRYDVARWCREQELACDCYCLWNSLLSLPVDIL